MKIMIIDGNSIINRAFYGVRLLSNRKGVYTNAIYGFFSTYLRLYSDVQPDGVCVCFDLRDPTFRHKEFDVYKAGRRPMPDELAAQIPIIKNLLDLCGIPRFELSGYEADDLIGTISHLSAVHGNNSVIVTGDRDSLQLIDGNTMVKLITTKGGQTITSDYDEKLFAENYCGLCPSSIIDLKALSGDKSDNIPGVSGIGDKTAMELLCRFGSLDGVYKNLDSPDIRESVRKKLAADRDNAYLSYKLASIDRTAPIAFTEDMSVIRPANNDELYALLSELELKSLISRLNVRPPSSASDSRSSDVLDLPVKSITCAQSLDSLYETCSGDFHLSVVFNFDFSSAALCPGQVCYTVSRMQVGEQQYEGFFKKLFCSDARIIMHNAKPVLRRFIGMGWEINDIYYDTAVAAYLLSPADLTYPLDACAEKYLGAAISPESLSAEENSDIPPLFANSSNSYDSLISREAAAVYALYKETELLLKKHSLFGLMHDIETPLISVLARMEHEGIAIDRRELELFGERLRSRINELCTQIYDHAGEQFNINSTKALGEILFNKLGLEHIKKTKTGYSTDIDVLNKLKSKHPIIPLIIEYRELTKLMSTYVDGLIKDISPADGRIHTTFQQLVTSTGRLSSTDPNLQNIPVRKSMGAEIRRMFTARAGCILVDADYSQIELRVLAHISSDTAMLGAFHSGEDIHAATASQVFGVPLSDVTPKMRSAAKAVNFGIVYGMSDFSLAEDLGISRSEAKSYIDSYLSKYSGIRDYMEKTKERAKSDGYVTTLFGRRRYLPELQSSNFNIRSFGERAAMNTPIQGTAADIIKIAMINVSRRLRREALDARLVLQIHDELIVEAPENKKDAVARILKEEMENVFEMKAPLIADVSTGKNWFEAK